MNRREFVTLVGGAAAWPTVMRAQTRLPVVGFLCSGTTDSDAFRVAAIEGGLREGGFVDGVNTKFVFRYSNDRYERLSPLLAEIIHENPSVIVLFGNAPAVVAKSANLKVPIIFAVGDDPIKMGLVSSFRRPEGNITGVSFLTNSVISKQLEVIHESAPSASLVGFLMNPANPNAENNRSELATTAATLGLKITDLQARSDSELETAFSTAVQQGLGALVVEGDNFLTNRRGHIVELAAQQKLPTVYPLREFVVAGGLMSYGTSVTEAYRIVGLYAGRILKGEKPTDLPVQQSTKVELVVNLKTAQALGVRIPQTLLARADEVIE